MSLLEAFRVSTGRGQLTWESLIKWVSRTYLSGTKEQNPHKGRRERMRERLRWYRGDHTKDIETLIKHVFEHSDVVKQRQKFARMAKSVNVTARLIDRISTVYTVEAVRRFPDQGEQRQLKQLERDLALHEMFELANQLVNLCNEVLFWATPTLRLITPDAFDVIPHPGDPKEIGALLMHWGPPSSVTEADTPQKRMHYAVWDDRFVVQMDAEGKIIDEPREHGLGRIPAVLVHRASPIDSLLDGHAGDDIIAAHQAVAFLRVLALRLAKSQGEKQPLLSGDLARIAAGQAADGERPIALPPGVEAKVLDTTTSPENYLKLENQVMGDLAASYDLSLEALVRRSQVDHMRLHENLTEIRRRQQKRWRKNERSVAELLGFNTSDFSVNFRDPALPMDPQKEFDLYREKSKQGLDDPLAYLMREDPDLDEAAAKERLDRHRQIVAEHIEQLAARNLARDADLESPGLTPESNGRIGGVISGEARRSEDE